MRRAPNPKPFLIMMIATILVSTGLCYMQYSAYGDVKAEVERLKKEQLDEKDVKKSLETATSELTASKVELSHLEQGVPEIAYVPTLLKELEKAGKAAGIEVLGVRPIPKAAVDTSKKMTGEQGKKSKKPDYTELDIQVSGRGDYKSVEKFVQAMQMFPKILATRTVSIQPSNAAAAKMEAKTGGPRLDLMIDFRAYLFPSDGSTKKTEATDEAPKEKVINVSGRNTVVN
jgi:Tfp pilus assembly protein PilO